MTSYSRCRNHNCTCANISEGMTEVWVYGCPDFVGDKLPASITKVYVEGVRIR